MSFPTIPSIRTFSDVKNALDNIRSYFSTLTSFRKVVITEPLNSATLTIADKKELKVNNSWELNGYKGGLTNLNIDTTKTVEVTIDGKKIKLVTWQ